MPVVTLFFSFYIPISFLFFAAPNIFLFIRAQFKSWIICDVPAPRFLYLFFAWFFDHRKCAPSRHSDAMEWINFGRIYIGSQSLNSMNVIDFQLQSKFHWRYLYCAPFFHSAPISNDIFHLRTSISMILFSTPFSSPSPARVTSTTYISKSRYLKIVILFVNMCCFYPVRLVKD